MLTWIIGASLFGGILSLIGGVFLLWKEELARKISLTLVSFAVGSLMGAAFLELLPEGLEMGQPRPVLGLALAGIFFVFLLEKFFIWHHHHHRSADASHSHPIVMTVLFGDGLHNFLDGLIIAISFLANIQVGVAATIAVFLHEIPQEIGDFGVLLHAGLSKSKVLLYNIAAASMTPLGALIGYSTAPLLSQNLPRLIPFVAGTFIYIAASDLIPELKRQDRSWNLGHLVAIFLGIGIIWLLGIIFPEPR